MSNITILKDALIYIDNYTKKRICNIKIENEKITEIKETNNYDNINIDIKIVDCNEKLVLPSFIDSHLHMPGITLFEDYGVNLTNDSSVDEYFNSLNKFKNKNGKHSTIVRGYGWDPLVLDIDSDYVKNGMLKRELDIIFPDIPLVIYSYDYHSCLCNSKTFELCGIDSNIQSLYGDLIETDLEGNPTGILHEGAVKYAEKKCKDLCFTNEEMEAAILKYQKLLHSLGITSVSTLQFIGGDYKTEWDVFSDIELQGLLKLNINGSIPVSQDDSIEEIISDYSEIQKYCSDKIRINSAKIFIDGVVDNCTALLNEKYENLETTGKCFWDLEKLQNMCIALHKHDIQIHSHAIGDKAVNIIVNSYVKAIKSNQKKNNRHVVTHLQLCDEKDIISMANNEIIACIQPFWITNSYDCYPIDIKLLGDRVKNQYKVGSFIKNGVIVTSSSDSPVTKEFSPLIGIHCAVNRDNKLEIAKVNDMIDTYTKNGAYQLVRENEIGILEIGKYADIVILDKNIFEIDKKELKNVEVLKTFYRGEEVFSLK